MKRIYIFVFIFSIAFTPLFAADFGATLSGNYLTENLSTTSPGNRIDNFVGIFAPWLSAPIGKADFYVSAGVQFDYTGDSNNMIPWEDRMSVIPELYKLELSARLSDSIDIRAGRIFWQDPSRLVARGSFDGADILYDMGRARVGVAAFYTGLLYSDTASINVSPTDPKQMYYVAPFDINDFANTYFAPRRALTILHGEFSGFPYARGTTFAGLMAQFDLSKADEKFHTQYLLLRHTMSYKRFDLKLAGVAGMENTNADGIRFAFATSVECGMRLPTPVNDRFSLGAKWASGEGPNTAAFFPVVMEEQSRVLKPYFSGIMALAARYEVRLHHALAAEVHGQYFFRTDTDTFFDSGIEKDFYSLGMELGGSLLWVPFSDLSLTFGGGAFIPRTGAAMDTFAPVRWSINIGTIFSL